MSLASQLLVFPSRMFLASQYIHKFHFQTSFLQRKASQPGKLKKSGTSFRPCSNATHQHCLYRIKDGIHLSFTFQQVLASWEDFCWYKPHHPTLLGPVKPPPLPHNYTLPCSYRSSTTRPEQCTMHMACIPF